MLKKISQECMLGKIIPDRLTPTVTTSRGLYRTANHGIVMDEHAITKMFRIGPNVVTNSLSVYIFRNQKVA